MFMNTRTERGKKERDVLPPMLMTLFVSHFERSPLNTEANRNTIKEISKERIKRENRLVYKYVLRSEYIQNMFMNTRTDERGEKEREGRTPIHVGDTGYIPLGDIFIKGILAFEHTPHTNNI